MTERQLTDKEIHLTRKHDYITMRNMAEKLKGKVDDEYLEDLKDDRDTAEAVVLAYERKNGLGE